jgi:hypothetical protein
MLKVDFFYFKLFEKDAENYANMLRTYFFGFFFATFGFFKKKNFKKYGQKLGSNKIHDYISFL